MAYQGRSYVEHVAIFVRDIDWHIRFFREVLGMTLREERGGAKGERRQAWTVGGMQFIEAPEFSGPEGRLAHLGVMVEDQEAALVEAARWNVQTLPQGRNWLKLPDGLGVEILQATGSSVAQSLGVDPRA
jgi:catechol 2,3-dioxygenase-like lactoylglutathione lyase family enzyme